MEKLEDWGKWVCPPFKQAPRESSRTRIEPPFAQHRITAAGNVWAIGMVMYQLATLDEPQGINNIVEQMNENLYERQDGKVLRSITTLQHPDYNEGLFDLILDCLKMTPEERPTPDRALKIINGWLQEYHERVQMDTTLLNGPKVFYKANNINHMTPGGCAFDLPDRWWRGWFNRHEIWLDERWGRLIPPYRPQHLDPWPREKHGRDEVLVPGSALHREGQRVKRRKTDADGDVAVDTEMEETLPAPQTTVQDWNKTFAFPRGFQNPQKRDPLATLLPPEIVNPPQPGLRERFRNLLNLSDSVANPDQSPAQARRTRQNTQNAGQQQQIGTTGPYLPPAQIQPNEQNPANIWRQGPSRESPRDENGLRLPWETP
jgi:serine/threonine protein kinase